MNRKILPAALVLVVAIFAISGCCGFFEHAGTPYNIAVSKSLNQNVSLFFTDKYGTRITSSEMLEWIYPQQRGLAPGTRYSFRFLFSNGTVAVPIYKEAVITANSDFPDFRINFYHSLPPANYTVELVVIEDDGGKAVAASNIIVYSAEQLQQEKSDYVMRNCSEFMAEGLKPYKPLVGPGENDTLYGCVRKIALERRYTDICRLMARLYSSNNSVFAVSDCIFATAVQTGDVSLCSQLQTTRQDVGLCRATIMNDWHECQKIECDLSCAIYDLDSQKDGCIKLFAIKKLDRKICDYIQKPDIRQSCLDFKYDYMTAHGN